MHPEHAISPGYGSDDTGFTVVAQCSCGDAFLGVGPDRYGQVKRQHRAHRGKYVALLGKAPRKKEETRRVRTLTEIVGGPGAWIVDPDLFRWSEPSSMGSGAA